MMLLIVSFVDPDSCGSFIMISLCCTAQTMRPASASVSLLSWASGLSPPCRFASGAAGTSLYVSHAAQGLIRSRTRAAALGSVGKLPWVRELLVAFRNGCGSQAAPGYGERDHSPASRVVGHLPLCSLNGCKRHPVAVWVRLPASHEVGHHFIFLWLARLLRARCLIPPFAHYYGLFALVLLIHRISLHILDTNSLLISRFYVLQIPFHSRHPVFSLSNDVC